jgi:alpha,alpha-trehalase
VFEKYTRTGDINDDEYHCSELLGWSASAFIVALETVRK